MRRRPPPLDPRVLAALWLGWGALVGPSAGCRVPAAGTRVRLETPGPCPATAGPRLCVPRAAAPVSIGIVFTDRVGDTHRHRVLAGECLAFPPEAAGAVVSLRGPAGRRRHVRLRAAVRHRVTGDLRVQHVACTAGAGGATAKVVQTLPHSVVDPTAPVVRLSGCDSVGPAPALAAPSPSMRPSPRDASSSRL